MFHVTLVYVMRFQNIPHYQLRFFVFVYVGQPGLRFSEKITIGVNLFTLDGSKMIYLNLEKFWTLL